MFGRYKTSEATRLIGLPSATIRTWRAQDWDFGRATGTEGEREHVYSRLGLLQLAIMHQVREAGASPKQAWSVAFWGAEEVARWAGIPNMGPPPQRTDLSPESDGLCQWLLMSDNHDPVVRNSAEVAFWLSSITGRESDGAVGSVMALVLNLKGIAEALPPALVQELKSSSAIPPI